MLPPRCLSAWLTLVVLVVGLPRNARADEQSPPPCTAPEFAQFDFWIGTWDLTWDGGSGTNSISKVMDSCVIQEQFEGGGFRGLSVSVYVPAAGHWKQTWVDNQGGYLEFTGGMEGDRMILSREAPNREPPMKQRMVFFDIAPDSLTWDWERSEDGGETWNLDWRIHYKRRGGS